MEEKKTEALPKEEEKTDTAAVDKVTLRKKEYSDECDLQIYNFLILHLDSPLCSGRFLWDEYNEKGRKCVEYLTDLYKVEGNDARVDRVLTLIKDHEEEGMVKLSAATASTTAP